MNEMVRTKDPTKEKTLTPALSQGERELEKKIHTLGHGRLRTYKHIPLQNTDVKAIHT